VAKKLPTFPVSKLTDGEMAEGWIICPFQADCPCRGNLVKGIPHAHKGEPKLKLGLGGATIAIAGLDNHDVRAMGTVEHGKGWVRGTYSELLEILYYIEASVPFFTGDGQDPVECAAVRNTSKSWRSKLDLSEHQRIPVPESARTAGDGTIYPDAGA